MAAESASIRGIHYATGEAVEVTVEAGVIHAITRTSGGEGLPLIGPGLVDLQINGYRGVDFNAGPVPPQDISRAVRWLWAEGVTSFLPTVITNSEQRIAGSMKSIAAACDADPAAAAAIAGIHLEGPFISPEDGPRGAHAREFVRAPDAAMFDRWQESAGGRIRIVTVSPEWEASTRFIEHCVQRGRRCPRILETART